MLNPHHYIPPMKPYTIFCLLALLLGLARAEAAPVITTEPASQIGDLTGTLNGTINVNSVGTWLIEFQLTENDNFATAYSVQPDSQFTIEGAVAGNNTLNLKATLNLKPTNLRIKPATTYYFRFCARELSNLSENFYGEVQTFTTLGPTTAPTAEPLPHYSPPPISHKEAELRVEVFSGSSLTKVFLQYGDAANNLVLESSIDDLQPLNTTEELSLRLEDLTPSQTYHYRWMVTNTEGSTYSEIRTFTTTAPPTLTISPATNVVADSAVLNGSVSLNGGMNAFISFEYGETAAYGKSISVSVSYDDQGNADLSALLSNLKSDTTYHYRLVTKQNQKRAISYSENMTFTTGFDGEKPVFLANPIPESINVSHVIVSAPSLFTGTSDTILSVEYGTTTTFGEEEIQEDSLDGFTTYSDTNITLGNLTANTIYHYRFIATNTTGATISETASFQTSQVPIAINNGTTAIGDLSARAQGTFTNYGGYCLPGIEWGTSTAYGNRTELTIISSSPVTTTRTASLATDPNTSYHYRFYIFDGTNYHYSEDKTFTSTAPYTLPQISDLKVQNIAFGVWNPYRKYISAESAQITAHVHSGAFSASFGVEYGKTNSLGLTETSDSQVSANSTDFLYIHLSNLEPETTYYWRGISTNSSGSFDSPIKTFTTLKAPVVSTQSAISITDSSVTIVGDISPDLWNYDLEFIYGTDNSLSNTIDQTSPDYVYGVYDGVIDTSNRNVTASLSGLLPNTTYYYKLRATTGNFYPSPIYLGGIQSFTTLAPATNPTITQGLQLLTKSDTTARLILGGFASENTDANVTFQYGTTQSYGSEVTHPDTFLAYTTGSPDIELQSLLPNTTYHVRAKIFNSAGATYSVNYQFTTLPLGTEPSFSDSPTAQLVTLNSAQLHAGTINSGNADATITFEYGLTTSYGSTTTQTVSANTISSLLSNISNLLSGTEYHFRITAQSVYGSVSTADSTFTTASGPEAKSIAASSISDITATLNGEFKSNNIFGYLYFDWGVTSSYGNSVFLRSTSNEATTIPLSHIVSELQPSTTYHFRARFRDRYGAEQYGEDLSFTTSDPSTLPGITGTPYTTELTPTGTKIQIEQVSAGGSPATITFEYGIDSNYGQEVSLPTPVDAGSYIDTPTVLLENLTANTTYHVRARATSSQGTKTSAEFVFSTAFNLTTQQASNVTHHEATFHGTINPGGQNLTVSFLWGTSPTSTNIAAVSPNTVNGFADTLVFFDRAGLPSDATYYYKLIATDAAGFIHYGTQQSFTTGTKPATPSILGEIYLQGSPNYISASFRTPGINSGDETTTLTAEYGTLNNFESTQEFGTIIPNKTTSSSFDITNLLPATEYQVRIKAESSLGSDYSNIVTFRTLALPVLTSLPATEVLDLSATINASLTLNGNYSNATLVYGTEGNFNRTIYNPEFTIDPSTGARIYSAHLTRLTPNTSYNYKLKSGTLESEPQTFTTLPANTPPIILGSITIPTAADLSDTKVRLNSGQMNAGSSEAQVVIQYGTSTAYGMENAVGTLDYNGSDKSFTILLSDLTPNTLYHARVKAINSEDVSFSPDFTFTTYPTPTIIVNSVTDITDISALFTGSVNPDGRPLDVRFAYKQGSSHTRFSPVIQVAGNSSAPVNFHAYHKLLPEKDYSCYLNISDGLNYYTSNTINFTTEPASSPPALLSDIQITSIGSKSAAVRLSNNATGPILSPGSSNTTLSFQYGTSDAYGQSVDYFGTFQLGIYASMNYSLNLPNLTGDTTYFIRAKLTNNEGETYSNPILFTTLPPILVETGDATNISEFSASISGTYDKQLPPETPTPSVSTSFEWGTTEALGSSTANYSPTNLTSLSPDTTYYYRLRAKYSSDSTYYYGEKKSFTTSPPSSLPSFGDAASVDFIRANSARVRVIWYTGGSLADLSLEYGTSSGFGSTVEVSSDSTPKATSNVTYYTLNDLQPNTTYYLRAKAANAQGSSVGVVRTFTTAELARPFDITASDILTTSANLSGQIQEEAASQTVRFEWGLDNTYGNTTPNAYRSGSLYRSYISGLLPSKIYHFRMVTIGDGLTQYSDDMTFTTSPSPVPPVLSDQISAFSITASAATLWMESVSAPADIVFEYGTSEGFGSQVSYPLNTLTAMNSAISRWISQTYCLTRPTTIESTLQTHRDKP